MTVRPLRRILSLQSTLVASVPFLLVSVLGAFWLLPEIRSDIETSQRELARAVDVQLETYLSSSLNEVQAIASLSRDKSSFKGDIHKISDNQLAASLSLKRLYAINRNGLVTWTSIARNHDEHLHGELEGIDLSHTPLYREAVGKNRPVWSNSFLSLIGSSLSIAVAIPWEGQVTVGEIDLGKLTEFLHRIAVREGEQIFIIDRQGQIIADEQGEYTGQQLNISDIPLVRRGISTGSLITGHFDYHGTTMVGTIIESPTVHWNILVFQPVIAAYRSALTTGGIVTAGLLASLLLGISAALIMARNLSQKIEALAGNARCIAQGRPVSGWNTGNIAEIGQLAGDLQMMAAAIGEREKLLRSREELLRAMMDNSFQYQGLLTPDGIVLDINRAALDLLANTKESVVGRHFWETPWWAHDTQQQEKLRSAILAADDTQFSRFEVTVQDREGSLHHVDFSLSSIRDNLGNVLYLIPEGRDITQLIRAEADRLKLSRAVEQSPVTIIITDVDGSIEYVNPKFTQLTGYANEEALGQKPSILKSGKIQEESYRQLWNTITRGETWQGELCNRKKGGELYWEHAIISPVIGTDGAITHFIGVKEDITEKKRARKELELDALRFENLYSLSLMENESEERVLHFVLEAAVKITASNAGYLYLLHENESELTLNTWPADAVPHCQLPRIHKCEESDFWAEAVRERSPVIKNDCPYSELFTFPDGGMPVKRYASLPVMDNGRIALVVGVGNKKMEYDDTDVQQLTILMGAAWRIIQKKRAEKSLLESEERFHQIFAQNDDAIILVDRKMRQIIDANPSALALFGVDRHELPQISPRMFIDRKDLRKLVRSIPRHDLASGFIQERASCSRADGGRLTVSLKGNIIHLRNDKVILCSIRNMSAKIRLTEELRASQAKLIQANKMTSLGMLVSSVAHEINNPNHCIAINSAVLTNIWREAVPILEEYSLRNDACRLGGLPFSEIRELVPQLCTGISESSKRISTIVVNMRDFVKNGQNSCAGSFDVNRAINAAATILWHNIQKYTNHFHQELASDLPPAFGNAQQVEQVIINLIVNALQSLPDKSRHVTIATSIEKSTGTIVITVADQGKGMDRKTLQRLSEPFFTTREAEGGTGLGLYISSTIVREYGGSLDFESEHGKGTIATIRLPAMEGSGQGAQTDATNDLTFSCGCVMRLESKLTTCDRRQY